ncbi:hypothetical protein L1887_43381 [Cichorium endivia]|nr:hypothetical protein L1887_43381 [Cichorium endivia]
MTELRKQVKGERCAVRGGKACAAASLAIARRRARRLTTRVEGWTQYEMKRCFSRRADPSCTQRCVVAERCLASKHWQRPQGAGDRGSHRGGNFGLSGLRLLSAIFLLGAGRAVLLSRPTARDQGRFGFSSGGVDGFRPRFGERADPQSTSRGGGIAWSHLGHKGPGSCRMPPTIEFSSQSQAHVLHRHEKNFAACCSPVFSMRERKKKVLAQCGNGSVPAPLGHCASQPVNVVFPAWCIYECLRLLFGEDMLARRQQRVDGFERRANASCWVGSWAAQSRVHAQTRTFFQKATCSPRHLLGLQLDAMTDPSASLLSTIRSVLEASPPAVAEPGTLRCHTLFSIPRQVKSLYPLAHIHPHDIEHNKRAASIAAFEEQIFITASWFPKKSAAGQADPKAGGDADATLLVLAMELYLYTIPESGAAVLYVSKLDSSGFGPRLFRPPCAIRCPARCLVTKRGLETRSPPRCRRPSHSTLRPFDTGILTRARQGSRMCRCIYWRAGAPVRKAHGLQGDIDARAFYLIPGYSKAESHPLVPLVRESDSAPSRSGSAGRAEHVLSQAGWVYGHPYSAAGASCADKDLPPLPLHWQTSSFVVSSSGESSKVIQEPGSDGYDPRKVRTVPTLMPHFSDDPKTRFLDEMAGDAHEHSGWKKKASHAPGVTQEEKQNGIEKHLDLTTSEASNKRPAGDEGDNSASQKRAKTEESSEAGGSTGGSGVPLVTLRALMRERELMDDLPIDEFWERMAFRQECCAGNAVGVLVILFTRHPSADSAAKTPERQPLSIPYKVLGDVVFKSLMKDTCEWNKISHARQLTQAWFHAVDKEVRRKGGVAQHLGHDPKDDGLIGQGIIWQDFQLRQAQEKASSIDEHLGQIHFTHIRADARVGRIVGYDVKFSVWEAVVADASGAAAKRAVDRGASQREFLANDAGVARWVELAASTASASLIVAPSEEQRILWQPNQVPACTTVPNPASDAAIST